VTTTFVNSGLITIPASGSAAPYPSGIFISGLAGTITKVTVTLNNINHTFPADMDVLLVGPGGQKTLLMSDAGAAGISDQGISNTTVTFDDAAGSLLPSNDGF